MTTEGQQIKVDEKKMFKIRPGVHYASVEDGVFFGTSKGRFVVKGSKPLFFVVDIMIPCLERGCTLESLHNNPELANHRRTVDALWKIFFSRKLLLSLHDLIESDRRNKIGLDSIAFLEREAADPVSSFEAIRAGKVLLKGEMHILASAARGLIRAGVSKIVLDADPADNMVRSLLRRYPSLVILRSQFDEKPDISIVVCERGCVEDIEKSWDGGVCIPIIMGSKVAIVGSACKTSSRWAQLESLVACCDKFWGKKFEPLPAAVGGAMVGALAGQEVFLSLAGLNDSSTVRIVYGLGVSSDVIKLPLGFSKIVGLEAFSLESKTIPPVDLEEALSTAQRLSSKWLGKIKSDAHPNIPQLPLSIATVEIWDGEDATSELARWGGNHLSAAVEAVLSALRVNRAKERSEVKAAGIDYQRWLLDGFLRWATPQVANFINVGYSEIDDGRLMNIWRTIEDFEGVPLEVEVGRFGSVPWILASVKDVDAGRRLSFGWGYDKEHALLSALGTALARVQVCKAIGKDLMDSCDVDTAALTDAPVDAVVNLRDAILDQWKILGYRDLDYASGFSSSEDLFFTGVVEVF